MSLLDQSGVTEGGLDPYNVHALFVNVDNMWTERFGNNDCLVSAALISIARQNFQITWKFLAQTKLPGLQTSPEKQMWF